MQIIAKNADWLISGLLCYVFPRSATHTHPAINVIHQTRPLSFISPWSSSNDHKLVVGAVGGGQR